MVEIGSIVGLMHATLGSAVGAIADAAHAAAGDHGGGLVELPGYLRLIPAMPMLSAVLCVLCACFKVKSKLPAWITVACLGVSFLLTLVLFQQMQGGGVGRLAWFDWFDFSVKPASGAGAAAAAELGTRFVANFAFHVDTLTVLWMLFVTGLGTLIALYASEYMGHDVGLGYARFFFAFSLFVFSMSCLVMGDNLIVLFLGWEGVGLCSYLLIGYLYKKPAAVAAAKKAFIMNRIGDLGLMMGIMGTWVAFGTVELRPLFAAIAKGVDGTGTPLADTWVSTVLPALFMVGAFGKSAQLFFYVWLPDAMEGPTPVSALIHAATMVTAGVYLIARMYPLYLADPHHTVLSVVGWSGAITAFWAATIGMAHFDIKRIMGYSTVSQLGYMFAGLGVTTSTGAAFHVFTHAFFKATLFLACGAVMHGFAGQLDLRKLSGVRKMKGWFIVAMAMLVGALNLAGFPGLAGFWSKDMILAEAFVQNPAIGWLLLLTAGLTAYYTFRAYFRVFEGPVYFEPGEDLHAAHDNHGHDSHRSHDSHRAPAAHAAHAHEFHPHAPGWAINLVLVLLIVGCFAIIPLAFVGDGHGGWVGTMVHHSTAAYHAPAEGAAHEHGSFLGMDPHKVMYYVSAVVGAIGIVCAFVLHLLGRTSAATANADKLVPLLGPLARGARAKWYVDEIYDFLIVKPLRVLSHIFFLLDQFLVDGLVNLAGYLPKALGKTVRPSQSGELHGYAVGMAGGVAVLLILVLLIVR